MLTALIGFALLQHGIAKAGKYPTYFAGHLFQQQGRMFPMPIPSGNSGQTLQNLPVGQGALAQSNGLAHQLHTPRFIGKGAVLFNKGGTG